MNEQPGVGRNTRILLLVLGLALVALVLGLLALGFFRFGEGGEDENGDQATTRHSDISQVRFDLDNAGLEVRVGGSEVVVERLTFRGEASEIVAGDSLQVGFDCPAFSFGCRGTYQVTVPSGTEIIGDLSNGRVTLMDVDGRVDVSTSNGAIEVTGATGEDLVLRTSNGSISGSGLTTPNVDLRTSNGRIEVFFAEPPRSVRARTSNGRIEVFVPSGVPPYSIDANASNGRTDLDIATDPSADLRMELTTSNGNIVVAYAD